MHIVEHSTMIKIFYNWMQCVSNKYLCSAQSSHLKQYTNASSKPISPHVRQRGTCNK